SGIADFENLLRISNPPRCCPGDWRFWHLRPNTEFRFIGMPRIANFPSFGVSHNRLNLSSTGLRSLKRLSNGDACPSANQVNRCEPAGRPNPQASVVERCLL